MCQKLMMSIQAWYLVYIAVPSNDYKTHGTNFSPDMQNAESRMEVAGAAQSPPLASAMPRSLVVLTCKRVPTPLKINMEHNHGGLEDHVPF